VKQAPLEGFMQRSEIARGGMRVIFQARDRELGRGVTLRTAADVGRLEA